MKIIAIAFISAFVLLSCTTVSTFDGKTLDRMPDGTYQGNIIFLDNSLFCKIVITGNAYEEFGSELEIAQKDSVCLSKGNYAFSADKIIFTQTNTTIDPICEPRFILSGEYFVEVTESTLRFWRDEQGSRLEYVLAKVEEQ